MAANPEFFPTNPDEEDDFFVINEEPDTGEMFNFYDKYSVDEFLRILRLVVRRHMDDQKSVKLIQILEHWERRVTDHITAHPEDRARTKIGFWYGEDNVARMELILDGSDYLR